MILVEHPTDLSSLCKENGFVLHISVIYFFDRSGSVICLVISLSRNVAISSVMFKSCVLSNVAASPLRYTDHQDATTW